jgi:3-oxosteroid 1-dehydrogenase
VLKSTVERFNKFALTGHDLDFGRGKSAYHRWMGDPRHKPNANLGTITRPPFFAVEVVPGDVGTAGGVVTDACARVLTKGGGVIPGLYGTGNFTAPVFGYRYPGAGASIAASMVFGFIAARHATGEDREAADIDSHAFDAGSSSASLAAFE